MALLERVDALAEDGRPGLQWSDFKHLADEAILDAAQNPQLTGRQKLRKVSKALIEAMDKAIEPDEAWAEALSDAGIRALVGAARAFAQSRFEKLRAKKRV